MSQIIIPGNTLRAAAIANAAPGQQAKAALDAEIMPTLAALRLDMAQVRAIGSKGDLLLFRGYRDLFGFGARPAMLLARKREPATNHVWFPLENLYVIVSGDAVPHAIRIAEQLYTFATKQDAHRVLDCLFEFAEDLLRTPPQKRLSARQWLDACAEDGMKVFHQGAAVNG